MNRKTVLLCLLVGVLTHGCTSLPEPRDPPTRAAAGIETLPLSLCMAPIRLSVTEEEAGKGHDLPRLVDAAKVAEETRRWLTASGAFAGVRLAKQEPALPDAWEHREDLLLEVSLLDLATTYEGHNGWWAPNLGIWFMALVPAWFVATEEYALTCAAEWKLRSVDSGRTLAEGRRNVRVSGTLDEMDRGWQFFGFLEPDNDAGNWQNIVELLLPAGRAEAAATITDELLAGFVPRARDPEMRARMRKTTALVVGVSEYRDPLRAPPLPYAASDARGVAQVLEDRMGIQGKHLHLLLDRNATKQKVAQTLEDLRLRTHEGDQLVVYFAGYGTRDSGGAPGLLTTEADSAGAGSLPLTEIASLLGGIEGECLVLLDCSFDGRGRSIRGGDPVAGGDATDLASLGPVAATILAASAGDHLVIPEQVRASLFAFHLMRGLRGDADRERDGVVTPGELFALLSENVVADAAMVGKRQRPRAVSLERPVSLRLKPAGGGAEPAGWTEP